MKITTQDDPTPQFTPFAVVLRVETLKEAQALKTVALLNAQDVKKAIGDTRADAKDVDTILDGINDVLDDHGISAGC